MFYKDELDQCDDPSRVAKNLQLLRAQLRRDGVPDKHIDSLLLATWNIRGVRLTGLWRTERRGFSLPRGDHQPLRCGGDSGGTRRLESA